MRQLHPGQFGWRVLAVACAVSLLGLLIAYLPGPGRSDVDTRAPLPEADGTSVVLLLPVARGFPMLTDIQFVPGSTEHAVVLVKNGHGYYVSSAPGRVVSVDECPLVLSVEVRESSELGLLGLAFHPDFAKNGLFYLNYNPSSGARRTRIAEWHVQPTRLGHQPARELRVLLEVAQPYDNHNAGQLAFGPDRMLYIGLGDGGAGYDPHGHGQNLGTLLGSMLRIDPKPSADGHAYTIPKDNPFIGQASARPEIWAYGLRNPWRYSFDDRGRLVVADVGQDRYEEVHIVERGDNLGWPLREGRHCPRLGVPCAGHALNDPIFEYAHDLGKSVIGGYQYHGVSLPSLRGKYVLGDYTSGRLWALELPARPGVQAESRVLGRFRRSFSSFGRDARGELYVGDFASGELLKLVPRARVP